MSDMNKRLIEKINNSTYCYAKEDGQGFVHKDECACGEGKDASCQEYKDSIRFHEKFLQLKTAEDGWLEKRSKIIREIKPEFKDSNWWKNNVVE